MGDSSSFSSLFALVDNHLAKSNVQQGESGTSTSGLSSFKLPLLSAQQEQLSTNGLSSPCLTCPLPKLTLSDREEHDEDNPTISVSDRPIHDVLSIQLSNMFKAREAKEEEERRKQEEIKNAQIALQKLKLEESSCLIDLMPAVRQAGQLPQNVEVISSSSSMESLLITDELTGDDDKQVSEALDIVERPISPKPITQDLSYILKHKIGKCSQFGKVLCARYRPVGTPYFRTHVPHNIKVFDFSTPSPDDIILEKLRKPTCYSSNTSNNTLMVFE